MAICFVTKIPNPPEIPYIVLYPACIQPPFGASRITFPENAVVAIFFSA